MEQRGKVCLPGCGRQEVVSADHLVNALREPMTFGGGLAAVWPDLLALAVTFVVAMAIAVRYFRWDSRPA